MPRKAEDMSRERRERGIGDKREGLNPAGAEICPAKQGICPERGEGGA